MYLFKFDRLAEFDSGFKLVGRVFGPQRLLNLQDILLLFRMFSDSMA